MRQRAAGRIDVMRAWLRRRPAWQVVLAYALLVWPILPADAAGVPAVALGAWTVAVLLFLAVVLIIRADGNGWGIYGALLATGWAVRYLEWPAVAGLVLMTVVPTVVVWLLYDRDGSTTAGGAARERDAAAGPHPDSG